MIGTKIRISEREISSLLEYFLQRAKVFSRFSSKIRISEREISSLLEYFLQRAKVFSVLSKIRISERTEGRRPKGLKANNIKLA